MSSETTTIHHDDAAHGEHEGMTKKRIMNVFYILLGITAVEFFVALVIAPKHPGALWINPIYIVLTLVKAFYIIAYFMHLKFEKMGLIMAIVLPVLFIIGLILVLTNESHYWIELRRALSSLL
ncbi:MAG: cytochrome C oxidase subunit IV family protein [Mucilaginibacter sp.]